jgi:hypothetical protein
VTMGEVEGERGADDEARGDCLDVHVRRPTRMIKLFPRSMSRISSSLTRRLGGAGICRFRVPAKPVGRDCVQLRTRVNGRGNTMIRSSAEWESVPVGTCPDRFGRTAPRPAEVEFGHRAACGHRPRERIVAS